MEKNSLNFAFEPEDDNYDQNHKAFEPLPFYDYKSFHENYDASYMKCNVNLYSTKKLIFMPKKPIKIQITAERKSISHVINPYEYTITIEHNELTWKVERTFKEIRDVHKALSRIVKAELGIACSNILKEDIKPDWPLFPLKLDSLIPESKINARCKNLTKYLELIVTYPPYRDHPAVLNLLSVSPLSFLTGFGPSLIEDMMLKKSGDTTVYGRCAKSRLVCQTLKMCHEKRWFCLKDTYIAYLNRFNNNSIGFIMLVDSAFECKMKIKANAYHAIKIRNLQHSLMIKCKNSTQQKDWYERIMHMITVTARAFHDSSYLTYDSYAPQRTDQMCRWYVNAASYMEHVMNGLNNAKEEIYIADWWLCPEIFLKRPTDDTQYRLDKILLKKAKEGVKIFILLYKEITFALNLMSLRTRQILTEYGANHNIKVLRHPDHIFDGVFLWSHHEKFVVIDQSIAFLGGIDLCYGRWDDDFHRLIDLGKQQNITEIEQTSPSKLPTSHSESNFDNEFKSIRYINKYQHSQQQLSLLAKNLDSRKRSVSRQGENDLRIIKAFTNSPRTAPVRREMVGKKAIMEIKTKINNKFKDDSDLSFSNNINIRSQRPTPTFDRKESTANHLPAKKPPVKWVTTKKEMIKNKKISLVDIFRNGKNINMKSNIDDDIYDRWHYNNNKINQSFIDIEDVELPKNTDAGYYYWMGKDYANAYREDFKDIQDFSKDQFDRAEVPRMPWRDQAAVIIGEGARDLGRHFIQRWNQCKNEQVPLLDSYPYLIPKCYNEPFNYNYREWFRDELYRCNVQMLRSADDWSAGISKTETSILKAYCDLIKKAKNYIYIENQFFITTTDPVKDNQVKNPIGLALVEKIKEAHKNNQKFRVYVVLPLLPGFDRINAIKAVQYYNLRSIKFGEYSIYKELQKSGIQDPSEYITFHGMRNWSVLMGKLVQEIIYVHSKLMIVDDQYVICGSANINDRSMLGKRDSEVAALITDQEFIESICNNQKVKVGKYAFLLRQKFFKIHLGINITNPSHLSVVDCVSDEFHKMFKAISHQNTLVFDEVFKCLPSDNILTFDELKNYSKQPSLSKANPYEGKMKLEKFVMGLIVDFPLLFLAHEKISFQILTQPRE